MARVIKRYENRKLYDTEAKSYVSLGDIAGLVRDGETVQVIDQKTGEDLTAPTLTQIILDQGKQGNQLISTDLLHDLLRRGTKAVDAGFEQIRHGVDDLVLNSFGRLQRFLETPQSGELKRLRTQLGALEGMLGKLLDDDKANDLAHEKADEQPNADSTKKTNK